MVKIRTISGWHRASSLPADPDFFFTPIARTRRKRKPSVPKVYPTFPPLEPHEHGGLLYRQSILTDLDQVIPFVDRLLSGGDFFCPRGQHISYYKYKTILVCYSGDRLIGWAVRQRAGSLIHLLVDPEFRGQGIGSHLLKVLEPLTIRSKSDQSTGDPFKFYEKHGYIKTLPERIGRKKNIDLLSKENALEGPLQKTPG